MLSSGPASTTCCISLQLELLKSQVEVLLLALHYPCLDVYMWSFNVKLSIFHYSET
jgi:hypothetical protein